MPNITLTVPPEIGVASEIGLIELKRTIGPTIRISTNIINEKPMTIFSHVFIYWPNFLDM